MQFNLENMPFLQLLEYESKYNPITLDEIDAIQKQLVDLDLDVAAFTNTIDALTAFMSGLGAEVDLSKELMTVVADDGGGIEKIYCAAIFRDEDVLVLKVGGNLFPLQQLEDSVTAGDYKGTFKSVKMKGSDGEYELIYCNFRKKGDKQIYEIPCIAAKGTRINEGELLACMESGQSIAPFFDAVGSGGNYMAMNDLEIGEYEILEITEGDPHPEYGRNFKILLGHGLSFFAKGQKFVNMLSKNLPIYQAALKKGKPLTLVVTDKKELSQGILVSATILIREPKVNLLAPTQVSVASLMPSEANGKQLVAAGQKDIPF